MIIPDILYDNTYPTIDENYRTFIESLLKEEAAIINLINSEADKIIKFAGSKLEFPYNPSDDEILSFIQSTKRVNDLILLKEWLLSQKNENAMLLRDKLVSVKGNKKKE